VVAAFLVLGGLSRELRAQQPAIAAGQVLRAGQDTTPVPGLQVVLHRVGPSVQGPIDSLATGPRGEFRFRYRVDSGAVYLFSAGYRGIEYFSSPLKSTPGSLDTGLVLLVSDTSSRAAVEVISRHIVVSKPAADGTRAVLEIVVLQNPGHDTRIAPDDQHPVWFSRLPTGALNFRVGEGDLSSDAFTQHGDSVALFAPVAPGEKQVLYAYQLPVNPGTVTFPIDQRVGTLTILLEEFDRRVVGDSMVRGDSEAVEGRSFRQWDGAAAAGSRIRISYPGSVTAWLPPLLLGLAALVLIGFTVLTLRRRPVPVGSGHAALLEELARLDQRYRGRQADIDQAEWARYQADRARLKAALSWHLAGTGKES
jgi:hypothetical protein